MEGTGYLRLQHFPQSKMAESHWSRIEKQQFPRWTMKQEKVGCSSQSPVQSFKLQECSFNWLLCPLLCQMCHILFLYMWWNLSLCDDIHTSCKDVSFLCGVAYICFFYGSPNCPWKEEIRVRHPMPWSNLSVSLNAFPSKCSYQYDNEEFECESVFVFYIFDFCTRFCCAICQVLYLSRQIKCHRLPVDTFGISLLSSQQHIHLFFHLCKAYL